MMKSFFNPPIIETQHKVIKTLMESGLGPVNSQLALEYFSQAIKLSPDCFTDLRKSLLSTESKTADSCVKDLLLLTLLQFRFEHYEDSKITFQGLLFNKNLQNIPIGITNELFNVLTSEKFNCLKFENTYFNNLPTEQIKSLFTLSYRIDTRSDEGKLLLQNVLWQSLISTSVLGTLFNKQADIQNNIFQRLEKIFSHGDLKIQMDEQTMTLFDTFFNKNLIFRQRFQQKCPVLYKKMCEHLDFIEETTQRFFKSPAVEGINLELTEILNPYKKID